MRTQPFLTAIAVLFVSVTVCARLVPFSPCPKLFGYYESETFEIFGAMTFDNDYTGNYKLEVEMSIATETEKNIRIVRKTKDYQIQNGNPIEYYVLFPFNHTFPKLTKVIYQGKLMCIGPREEASKVTPLRATNEVTLELVSSLTTTKKPKPKPNVPPTSNAFPNDVECGQNVFYTPLVVNGSPTISGEYPWLVAIFQNVDGNFNFRCAGSLITDQYVVTAAHCVKLPDKSIVDKKSLYFVLGKHNIRNWPIGSQIKSAVSIHVHPDYTEPSDADIAIIRLNTPVTYGPTVKPICVWNEDDLLDHISGQNGTVAGWGRDENNKDYVEEARKVDLAVIDVFDCIKQDSRFSKFTSRNTFCGGNGRGAVPCTGDSGGSFVMKRDDNKYYMRGIVSATLKSGAEACDVTKNTVFTDVAKYSQWMKSIVED